MNKLHLSSLQSPPRDVDPAELLMNLRKDEPSEIGYLIHRNTSLHSTTNSSFPTTQATEEGEDTNDGYAFQNLNGSDEPFCTCKRSRCLKKYCACFAANGICNATCRCSDCENRSFDSSYRIKAITELLQRNPSAFVPKLKTIAVTDLADGSETVHRVGCRCRKSHCLKKYCECYQGKAVCQAICTCLECHNYPGAPGAVIKQAPATTAAPVKYTSLHTRLSRMESESAVLPVKTDLKNKLRGKRTLSLDERLSHNATEPATSCAPFQRYEEEQRFPFQRAASSGFQATGRRGGGVQLLSQNLQVHNQMVDTTTVAYAGIAMSRLVPIEEEDPLTKVDNKKRRLSQDTDTTTEVCEFHIDPSDFPIDGSGDGPPTTGTTATTPAVKKTRFDSSTTFHHTTSSSSFSMLTPKCQDGTAPSPTMLSVAKVFHLLGDSIACGKIGKGFSVEQRKQFRESLSSSTSSKGMIAIAENVLTSMRFSSGDDFNMEELNEETKENLMSGMLSGMLGGLANQQDGNTPTTTEAESSLAYVSSSRDTVVRMEI